jgi:hypothetical protein
MNNLEKQPKCYSEIKANLDKALLDRLRWLNEYYQNTDVDMQYILGFEIEDINKLRKILKKH